MFRSKHLVSVLLAGSAWLIMSCSGEESSTKAEAINSYASYDDMPNCTANREGEKALAEDENLIYVCNGGRWTEGGAYYISEDDLPNCTEKREGENAYVEKTASVWTCSDGSWTENPDSSPLVFDVVYRDFNSDHSDFENFSEEYMGHSEEILKAGYAGYDVAWATDEEYHLTCGNQESRTGVALGGDGLLKKIDPYLPDYLQSVSSEDNLKYGGCKADSTAKVETRGFLNALNSSAPSCKGVNSWSNPIYVTTGMAKSYLMFDKGKDGKIDMLDGVHIQKAAELCDNKNFDQWFADVEGVNLRTNAALELAYEDGEYVYSRTWDNDGFFPLDEPCNAGIQPNGKCENFGPQSFSTYCPPYDYKWAALQTDYKGESTKDLCSEWLKRGGPRATKAASAVAKNWNVDEDDENFAANHLKNYHYSMMGYLAFAYSAGGEKGLFFEFASSEDIWVYVDGVLVSDLGGTHLPAPGKIDIGVLAANNHGCNAGEPLAAFDNCAGAEERWADGSVHHLHFFKMSRNTNGADFYIRTNLKQAAEPKYK